MAVQPIAPTKGLNVSLEPHLLATLTKILNVVPKNLKTELAEYVAPPPKPIVAHELLHSISLWSRTVEGEAKLRSKSLKPQEYSMVSLLAGTTTSPEKSFGDYTPAKGPEVQAADSARERKAITALVNSLFSIFGAGLAAWWGADKTGWREEYKVLFALAVGLVVAISEGVLFLIWSSRRSSAGTKRYDGLHKKDEIDLTPLEDLEQTHVVKASAQEDEGNGPLRHRRQ